MKHLEVPLELDGGGQVDRVERADVETQGEIGRNVEHTSAHGHFVHPAHELAEAGVEVKIVQLPNDVGGGIRVVQAPRFR